MCADTSTHSSGSSRTTWGWCTSTLLNTPRHFISSQPRSTSKRTSRRRTPPPPIPLHAARYTSLQPPPAAARTYRRPLRCGRRYMYLGITLSRLDDFENSCAAYQKAIEMVTLQAAHLHVLLGLTNCGVGRSRTTSSSSTSPSHFTTTATTSRPAHTFSNLSDCSRRWTVRRRTATPRCSSNAKRSPISCLSTTRARKTRLISLLLKESYPPVYNLSNFNTASFEKKKRNKKKITSSWAARGARGVARGARGGPYLKGNEIYYSLFFTSSPGPKKNFLLQLARICFLRRGDGEERSQKVGAHVAAVVGSCDHFLGGKKVQKKRAQRARSIS